MTEGPPAGPPVNAVPRPTPELDLRTLFRLDGKRALVAGGYGGIGESVTRLLVSHGADVVIAGRSQERADALAAELTAGGARAFGDRIDLADPESIAAAVGRAVETIGGLDVVVNLAAVDREAQAEEMSDDEWRVSLEVNLTGAFKLSQAAARLMIAAGEGGRIIHFSSTRSVAGGRRGFAAYAASKGGLNALVRQLATEWGKHGITVNAVGPGFVPTDLVRSAAADDRFTTMMLNRIPVGRFGTPLEMAGAVLFLAAPAGGFVTGQVLFVDGGVTASS